MEKDITGPQETPIQNLPSSQSFWAKNQKAVLLIATGAIFLIFFTGVAYYLTLSKSNPKDVQQVTPTSTIQSSNPKPNSRTKLLATLESGENTSAYTYSTDGKEVAYVKEYPGNPSKYTVLVNSTESRQLTEVRNLIFSPDNKRVAYIGRDDDKKMFVAVDGKAGKKYDYIMNLVFSPDSQNIAYAAGDEIYTQFSSPISGETLVKKSFVVVNDNEGKKYDGSYVDANAHTVYDPVFSGDSKTIAYSAFKDGKTIVVVGEQEFSKYSTQEKPLLGPKENQLAYIAHDKKDYFVVFNGKELKHYNYIHGLAFGQDGQQLAYVAKSTSEDGEFVVLNDQEKKEYITIQHFTFSLDGKQIAYFVTHFPSGDSRNYNKFLVIDNKELEDIPDPTFAKETKPVFSSDGKVAYLLSNYEQTTEPTGRLVVSDQNKTCSVNYGGEQYSIDDAESLHVIPSPVFSLDGNYIGYGIKKGNQLWWEVRNIDLSACKLEVVN